MANEVFPVLPTKEVGLVEDNLLLGFEPVQPGSYRKFQKIMELLLQVSKVVERKFVIVTLTWFTKVVTARRCGWREARPPSVCHKILR